MRCGDSLVSLGDTKFEVFAKCGSPVFQNWLSTKENIEQTAYSHGPGTLLKILTFDGGKLIRIEDGSRIDTDFQQKSNFIVKIGDLQADIYMKYGTPKYREFTEKDIEQWIYDLADGSFLKNSGFQGWAAGGNQ